MNGEYLEKEKKILKPIQAKDHKKIRVPHLMDSYRKQSCVDMTQQNEMLQHMIEQTGLHQTDEELDTAPGSPVQELKAPKKSWKTRKREAKEKTQKTEEARKQCGSVRATDMAVDIHRTAEQVNTGWENSLKYQPIRDLMDRYHLPPEHIRGFLQGYHEGAGWDEATEQERLEQDRRLLERYCVGLDLPAYQRQVLGGLVDRVLLVPLSPDILQEGYIRSHLEELKRDCEMAASMRCMMRDTRNQSFFDQMDPMKREILERNEDTLARLSYVLKLTCKTKGADLVSGAYKQEKSMDKAGEKMAAAEGELTSALEYCQCSTAEALIRSMRDRVLQCDLNAMEAADEKKLAARVYDLTLMTENLEMALKLLEKPDIRTTHGRPANDMTQTIGDTALGQQQMEFYLKGHRLLGLAMRARELHDGKKARAGQLTQGQQQMQLAADMVKPGTMAYLGRSAPFAFEMNRRMTRNDGKCFWNDLEDRMLEDSTFRDIRQRVQAGNYYSLEYTKEETQTRCGRTDIGEPIFRTLYSFGRQAATQSMMDENSLEEMVRNIGAGAGLYKEDVDQARALKRELEQKTEREKQEGAAVSETELAEREAQIRQANELEQKWKTAVEQNRKGLAVYKKVIAVHYGYLARKYGAEKLQGGVAAYLPHAMEIKDDFGTAQVDGNMKDRYQDWLDLNNPEDLLLYHRIAYFNGYGHLMNSLTISAIYPEVEEVFREDLEQEETVKSYQWLLEHDPSFAHKDIKWNTKIEKN